MRINLLEPGYSGVDMKSNAFLLQGKRKLRFAVNLVFDEGSVKTRPGFRYTRLAGPGPLQGFATYQPSRGISAGTFSEDVSTIATVVAGTLRVGCDESGKGVLPCETINLFQAENYLILQSPEAETFWWKDGVLTQSPGMNKVDWNDPETPVMELDPEAPVAQPVDCEEESGPYVNTHLRFLVLNHYTEMPIFEASVKVRFNTQTIYQNLTDVRGRYDILRVVPRAYVADAAKEGFIPKEDVPAAVELGQDRLVVIRLIPLPVTSPVPGP